MKIKLISLDELEQKIKIVEQNYNKYNQKALDLRNKFKARFPARTCPVFYIVIQKPNRHCIGDILVLCQTRLGHRI